MKYKIGEVSKILGISPDLLRYYQKKGVVQPTLGESNNYRYYDAWDINFLIDCLWFKNFGFGIEQTAHLVSSSTFDDVVSEMHTRCEEIEANIRREELLLARSRQYFAGMERARSMLGTCDLVYSPAICRYLNRYNYDYRDIADMQELSHQWLQYMPFVSRCFEIERTDLENKTDNYAWGFSMSLDFAEKLQVSLEPPVAILPAEPSVHTVFTSSGKTSFSPRHLKPAMDFVRAHGLTVTGNARGNLICSVLEEDALTGYFEVWIPVAPKDGLVFSGEGGTHDGT